MSIANILNTISPLPDQSVESLISIIQEEKHLKGEQIISSDTIDRNIYFIREGFVRAYTTLSDNEVTFWFGQEGDTIVSMRSYVDNQKGYENIELLEDCILYKMNVKELNSLFASDLHIANWGRRFAERELLKTEERLIARQVKTASERYAELLRNSPQLIQRTQLSYIASYLGITQVSLSRIRAKLK